MQRYESTSTAIRPTIDILNVNALRSLLWRIMHLTKAFFGQLWRLIMLRLSAWKSAGLLNCFRCTIDSNLFSRAGHGSIFFLFESVYIFMCLVCLDYGCITLFRICLFHVITSHCCWIHAVRIFTFERTHFLVKTPNFEYCPSLNISRLDYCVRTSDMQYNQFNKLPPLLKVAFMYF